MQGWCVCTAYLVVLVSRTLILAFAFVVYVECSGIGPGYPVIRNQVVQVVVVVVDI